MPDNCLIFYRLSLDFFVVFQDKLQYWLVMGFYVLQHGWYMQSNSDTTVWYVGNKQIMWKYMLFWSKLPAS